MQEELFIFWNHVGREHGEIEYAPDIRKNSVEIKERSMRLKEHHYKSKSNPNRFIKHDETTLVELPPADSKEKFIIVYCIEDGLQFSLHHKTNYSWWLADIVEVQEIRPNIFCIHDLFLDISINKDGSYKVLDVDEYEAAVDLGLMSSKQIKNSLTSFHRIVGNLNTNNFPNGKLKYLKEKYM
ncbi:DUF402 domain-containing protein [Metaplanococcus flavidus]|uniref:DUF402 domain-containing protein n=1 Tax=Metaplanococcus flavidus TaxID=569883 RepID=A0ABW3LFJ3_9BACL